MQTKTGDRQHPRRPTYVNSKEIPIWVSDYVLAGASTSAIMAVRTDNRDWEFTTKFGIPMVEVVAGVSRGSLANIVDGVLCSSDLNGCVADARRSSSWLVERAWASPGPPTTKRP